MRLRKEMDVSGLIQILMYAAALIAAILIGNWFLEEVKKARKKGSPWYTPYFSLPGLIIVLALVLPMLFWILKSFFELK
jgi:NADH:ubiquinone oxidoreductase subunit 6 (subunit J)